MGNVDFFRQHARPGAVGLVGGDNALDRGIRKAQRYLDAEKRPSPWSHAMIFEGERADGRLWVLESNIEWSRKQLRNGVLEERVDKYDDGKEFPNVAVLDFGLDGGASLGVIAAGLELLSAGTLYALGGILKTYVAMLSKKLAKDARTDGSFCSSFVRTLYKHVGIDLAPGVAVRHTTPEHLARTPVRHERHLLIRHTM